MHVRALLTSLLLLPLPLVACTAYVMHNEGRTFIGNNEDSWCTQGQVRFAPGAADQYGAVYFGTYTGHPFREWADQIGMNEAGLVFDGLSIQPKDAVPQSGKKQLYFAELTNRLLERCATVPEAVAFLDDYDRSFLHQSMLFLADANGAYAIVQSDTVIVGSEPTFAVGNWRMACNTDMDAIPIPRLQTGRTLLSEDVESTLEGAVSVLSSMRSCREFLGNGTFISTLFEPDSGRVHLYFYHDFDHPVVFDLHAELAKGPHTLDLPTLFPPNAEFQALQAYKTPFHQRGLFYFLEASWILAGINGIFALVQLVRRSYARIRGGSTYGVGAYVTLLTCSMFMVILIPILLVNEGVFYFGLGDATDRIHSALKYVPLALVVLTIQMIFVTYRTWSNRAWKRWVFALQGVIGSVLVILLFYWQLVTV